MRSARVRVVVAVGDRDFGDLGRLSAEARKALYKKLVKQAKRTARRLEEARARLAHAPASLRPKLEASGAELDRIAGLHKRVIFQCEERVFRDKQLSPDDKVVSVFETHADIIVKGQRDTEFGHKVFLTSGKSGLILDCRIEDGNPADANLFMEMVRYQKRLYGKAPRQTSADGGFATRSNVEAAKEIGVEDVCFSKPCGIAIGEMVRSQWASRSCDASAQASRA